MQGFNGFNDLILLLNWRITIEVLPFVYFYYTMDNNILDYVSSEKDHWK